MQEHVGISWAYIIFVNMDIKKLEKNLCTYLFVFQFCCDNLNTCVWYDFVEMRIGNDKFPLMTSRKAWMLISYLSKKHGMEISNCSIFKQGSHPILNSRKYGVPTQHFYSHPCIRLVLKRTQPSIRMYIRNRHTTRVQRCKCWQLSSVLRTVFHSHARTARCVGNSVFIKPYFAWGQMAKTHVRDSWSFVNYFNGKHL